MNARNRGRGFSPGSSGRVAALAKRLERAGFCTSQADEPVGQVRRAGRRRRNLPTGLPGSRRAAEIGGGPRNLSPWGPPPASRNDSMCPERGRMQRVRRRIYETLTSRRGKGVTVTTPRAESRAASSHRGLRVGSSFDAELENRLRSMVCDGKMTLSAARHGIATNWKLLYRRVFGVPA
jgi:hypothetical protein